MGFCDKCNKYRELRYLVSYAKAAKITRAVCADCFSHEKFTVVARFHYEPWG